MDATKSGESEEKTVVKEALIDCADFLSTYVDLANSHPVDFIIKDLWNVVLSRNIQKQLSALTEHQLQHLPSGNINTADSITTALNLNQNNIGAVSTDFKELKIGPEIDAKNDGNTADQSDCVKACACANNIFPRRSYNPDAAWAPLSSLQDFLSSVHGHCLDSLLFVDLTMDRLRSVLQVGGSSDAQQTESSLFVRAFMKEKKMHEVEIMADVCKRIFHKSSADVVLDLGSGKGYLSTCLSLQHRLPVIAIDSQPGNTSGAEQRAERVSKEWNTRVKSEKKRSQKSKETRDGVQTREDAFVNCSQNTCSTITNCSALEASSAADVETHNSIQDSFEDKILNHTKSKIGDSTLNHTKSKIGESTHVFEDSLQTDNKCDTLHTEVEMKGKKLADSVQTEDKSGMLQSAVDMKSSTQKSGDSQQTEDRSGSLHIEVEMKGSTQTFEDSVQTETFARCVNLTMYVTPSTDLTELIKASAEQLHLPLTSDHQMRLFLTGLHTCGPLAPSMLRLFVKNEAVRTVCGVGCCYQLMQESFLDALDDESAASLHAEGDFPLSSILQERRMVIGRTALNMASLALPRMAQTDGELQGKTFYPRALLQAYIHEKLGYVPQDLKKLRKMARKTNGPVDYVVRALKKLALPGCEAHEEEVAAFHEKHRHQEARMAAFFQLRAVLAPVVETVVLLDRLLFLLEQDCVENAFLVRLFDPVTSPRCHALVAFKKELS